MIEVLRFVAELGREAIRAGRAGGLQASIRSALVVCYRRASVEMRRELWPLVREWMPRD